jgi:2-oxoglutarate ferredoxin oxidoreductase subunit beta
MPSDAVSAPCAPLAAAPGETLVFDAPACFVDRPTHYCPGCHHGVAQRLAAELIDELRLREKALLVGSVGCSVFVYNYLNIDAVEAPHGRGCAVATGLKRARPDNFVFTFQGDGDLASIGLAESLHAANRGERFTAIFINNTVYGMTGGQMAPTTLPGQKTTTSQNGRDTRKEGPPLRMAEMMASLGGVAYAAREALDSVSHIRAAKKALRRAFEVQLQDRGFGFVELLSACPTNWRMDPTTANERIGKEMIPAFPLGSFKDAAAPEEARP